VIETYKNIQNDKKTLRSWIQSCNLKYKRLEKKLEDNEEDSYSSGAFNDFLKKIFSEVANKNTTTQHIIIEALTESHSKKGDDDQETKGQGPADSRICRPFDKQHILSTLENIYNIWSCYKTSPFFT